MKYASRPHFLTVAALPLCVYELHKQNYEKHVLGWFVAGIFVFLAVPISVGEVR